MNTLDKNTLMPLRALLLGRETELLAEIKSAKETSEAGVSADTRDVDDLEDMASRHERTTLKDAEIQRDRNELADVHAALARLDDGSYGNCIDCTQLIAPSRLAAIPAAARCMECQTKFESRAVQQALTSRP